MVRCTYKVKSLRRLVKVYAHTHTQTLAELIDMLQLTQIEQEVSLLNAIPSVSLSLSLTLFLSVFT